MFTQALGAFHTICMMAMMFFTGTYTSRFYTKILRTEDKILSKEAFHLFRLAKILKYKDNLSNLKFILFIFSTTAQYSKLPILCKKKGQLML